MILPMNGMEKATPGCDGWPNIDVAVLACSAVVGHNDPWPLCLYEYGAASARFDIAYLQ